MKYTEGRHSRGLFLVTLSVRVWIEISEIHKRYDAYTVTLSVRVWIEMSCGIAATHLYLRHPQCEGVD